MGYAGKGDFERFYEGFATYYYGNRDNSAGTLEISTSVLDGDIASSFDRINILLDSIGRVPIVPVGTNVRTGKHHPHLIEWNVVDTIFTKLRARHMSEFRDKLPDWMLSFATRADQIFDDIVCGRVVLDTDTTTRGIGYPVKIAGRSVADFHTNWDSGFYSAVDFPKVFRFRVSGTSEGNEIGQAKFVISEDDGYSYLTGEYETGTSWIHIKNGLSIRWKPAATLGIGTVVVEGTPTYYNELQIEFGDVWQVKCVPMTVSGINSRSTFKTFGRG